MTTVHELLDKVSSVVKTELRDSGCFTPHFSVLDPFGQITIFALSELECEYPQALFAAFQLMDAYSRCFRPVALILVCGHPNHPQIPTITAFDFSNESSPVAATASPSPTIAALPSGFVEVFLHIAPRHPQTKAEQAEAAALWACIDSNTTRTYLHPSIGNN